MMILYPFANPVYFYVLYFIIVSLDIIKSWISMIDENGWVAREQILGAEARSKVKKYIGDIKMSLSSSKCTAHTSQLQFNLSGPVRVPNSISSLRQPPDLI